MDLHHQDNVIELETIINDYKIRKIDIYTLTYYLEHMVKDIKNQMKEDSYEIINSTHIYEKSTYNKSNFYKYLELLFVKNIGDKNKSCNTGSLKDLTLIIELNTNNIVNKIILDGKFGDIIIDKESNIPFTKKGDFSVKVIYNVLKKIKEMIDNESTIKLYFGLFYDITQDDIKDLIKDILKEWFIFFIEECNITKDNISLKFDSEDEDKFITYLVKLI